MIELFIYLFILLLFEKQDKKVAVRNRIMRREEDDKIQSWGIEIDPRQIANYWVTDVWLSNNTWEQ